MKHIVKEGDYLFALSHLMEHGGQLFAGRHPGASNCVVNGSRCTTYWEAHSKTRAKVILLSAEFGIDPTFQTHGRLAKYYLEEILCLPYRGTYFCNDFRKLALEGWHWHYLHNEQGEMGYCFELDVKSAYVSTLLTGKTLLYDKYKGFVNDGGALENLRNSVCLLPKDFRLILLGVLASHSKNFWVRGLAENNESIAMPRSISHISYGAAFNAVHGAILKLYRIMRRAHEIGGEWIARIHTDSLLVKADIPPATLNKLVQHFQRCELELVTKAEGRAYLFDLNSGFIGSKIIGSPRILASHMKASDVKYWASQLDDQLQLKWKEYRVPTDIDTDWSP